MASEAASGVASEAASGVASEASVAAFASADPFVAFAAFAALADPLGS